MKPALLLQLAALTLAGFAHADGDPRIAAEKAAEAAYIQTGIRDQVESVKGMANRTARDYVRGVGVERELGVLIGIAQVVRTEQLTVRVGSGKTITLTRVSLAVTFSF